MLGGYGDDFGAPALALGEDDVEIGASGERDGVEAVGVGLADAEGALADGAGRAEDGDLLHTVYFSRERTARVGFLERRKLSHPQREGRRGRRGKQQIPLGKERKKSKSKCAQKNWAH